MKKLKSRKFSKSYPAGFTRNRLNYFKTLRLKILNSKVRFGILDKNQASLLDLGDLLPSDNNNFNNDLSKAFDEASSSLNDFEIEITKPNDKLEWSQLLKEALGFDPELNQSNLPPRGLENDNSLVNPDTFIFELGQVDSNIDNESLMELFMQEMQFLVDYHGLPAADFKHITESPLLKNSEIIVKSLNALPDFINKKDIIEKLMDARKQDKSVNVIPGSKTKH